MWMLRESVLVAAVTLLVASTAVAEQRQVTISGYVPPVHQRETLGPNYTLCPEPWVQMVSDGSETWYAEVWHCVSHGHSCFRDQDAPEYSYGCSGNEMKGWTLPSGTADFRAEIMEHVINPCWLDMAHRHNTVEGLSDEAFAMAAQMANPETVEEMVQGVSSLLRADQTEDERTTIYNLALGVCITAARGG